MKIAVRVFTMAVVFTGLTLASLNSASASTAQPASAYAGPGPLSLPVPQCGPGVPTCPQQPPPPGGLR